MGSNKKSSYSKHAGLSSSHYATSSSQANYDYSSGSRDSSSSSSSRGPIQTSFRNPNSENFTGSSTSRGHVSIHKYKTGGGDRAAPHPPYSNHGSRDSHGSHYREQSSRY